MLPSKTRMFLFAERGGYDFSSLERERTSTLTLFFGLSPSNLRMLPPVWPVAPRIAYADMVGL